MGKNCSPHYAVPQAGYRFKLASAFLFGILSVLLSMVPNDAAAQAVTVTGRVTDRASGEPLVGVSVVPKGTSGGTTTDRNGSFSVQAAPNGTLVLSSVGYGDQEVPVSNRRSIDVTLERPATSLNEVVVVGYGTQRRKDVTGAVASVNARQLQDRAVSSFTEALAGQVAGVQVQQTSAAPGGGIQIKVRGTGSITAGNTPLYVIDGVPIDNAVFTAGFQGAGVGEETPSNPLASINPGDIQSIEILKDASATSIYGSRGANGVVLITTKMGTVGRPQISLNVSTAWQRIAHKVPMMTAQQYAQRQMDARNINWERAGGKRTDPNSVRTSQGFMIPDEFRDPSKLQFYDWQDVIYGGTAPMQNYELSASGGTDAVRYYLSGNYMDQDGIARGSNFKKYAFRGNIDAKVSDRIRVGFRVAPSYTVNDFQQSVGIAYQGGVNTAILSLPPIFPVYNADGSYANSYNLHYDDGATQTQYYSNPLAYNEGTDQLRRHFNTVGSVFANVDILKSLTFRTSFSADVNMFNYDRFIPSYVDFWPSVGFASSSNNVSWINENTLTYNNTFRDKHNLNVLAGVTEQKSSFYSTYLSAGNFPNDVVRTLNAGIVNYGNTFKSQWTLVSLLGRVNYNYDDKYLLTATVRRDGSSRFGANNKWGAFPSASIGWRVSNEAFMEGVPKVSELKLRASYGLIGNNQIPDYASLGLVGASNYILGSGNGNIASGQNQYSLGNADLGWERAKELDLGLDLGLFDNRVYLIADYYNKLTSELLLDVPVPLSTGYATALRNIGKVRNKGFEFSLETRNIQKKDFTWTTNINFSRNVNKVEALGLSGTPIIVANRAQENSLTHISAIGHPLGSFYGYVFDGIFKDQAEVDKYPHLNGIKPGDARFRDINSDGKIDDNDKTFIGSNLPDFTYGITNTLTYKGFDLSATLQGVQGAEVINLLKRSNYGNLGGDFVNYWRSPEEPGDGKTPQPGSSPYNRTISSWLVEDVSYLRIKNVTLGYRVNPKWLGGGRVIKNARAYVNVQNLYTFTKYTGYNPDVNTTEGDPWISSALTPGIDYGTYPMSRTIAVGLNLTF